MHAKMLLLTLALTACGGVDVDSVAAAQTTPADCIAVTDGCVAGCAGADDVAPADRVSPWPNGAWNCDLDYDQYAADPATSDRHRCWGAYESTGRLDACRVDCRATEVACFAAL